MDLSGTVTNLWSFPGGFLQGMTIGPDGSPWFTDVGNNDVVRL
jgi:streptogramin lyase